MCSKRNKRHNIIANKNEAQAMTNHISCNCKCKFNSRICNSNPNCNDKKCQYECRIIVCAKKIIVGILAHVFVRKFDKIIIFMDDASTKKKINTIATNVTSTASINCYSIKVRNCYILLTAFLAVILLLIIVIICYHYAKQKGKI